MQRFQLEQRISDLEHALTNLDRWAATAPADHPDRPRVFSTIGTCNSHLYVRTNDENHLTRAISAHEIAVDSTPAQDAHIPINCV